MKLVYGILLFLLSTTINLKGQDTIVGDLQSYINSFIDNIPGSSINNYQDPTGVEIQTCLSAITHFKQAQFSSANDSLTSIGYKLNYFEDTITASSHYVFEKSASSTNHWGTFIFNIAPCRSNIVVQSPHPKYDSNTGKQGIHVYLNSQVYGYMVAGTHRCNSTVQSTCDGKTGACSSTLIPYPISDMAHNTNTIFQLMTIEFYHHIVDPFFLSLHGFSKRTTDPYMIFSNSSNDQPTTPRDMLLALANQLVVIDPVLSYQIPHINTSWTRLTGGTNVQGRHINTSPNPCTISSPMNKGRFFHLEQERSRLRQSIAEWDKMAQAINVVFRSIDVSQDTILQNFISAPDSLHIHNFDTLTTLPTIFQTSTCITIDTNVLIPAQEVLFRIKQE